jgi:hypothetical protein
MKPLLPYLCLFLILIGTSCQEQYSDAMIQQQVLWNANIQRTNLILKSNTSFKIEEAKNYIIPRTQYHSFYPKFKYITTQSDSLYNEIERLKRVLLEHSGGYASNAKPISTKTLTANIQSSYNNYLHFMEKSWDNGGIKATIFADTSKKENFMQEIKATLNLPFLSQIRDNPTYLERQLKDKPLAVALTLLSSIQNDVRKQEYHIFHFFDRQIGRMHNYKRVGLWAISSKFHIRLGEIYKSEILLGSYLNNTLRAVVVNGNNLPLVNKRAIYKIKPTQIGEQAYRPIVRFLNPYTNLVDSLEKTFYFDVID